MRLPRLALATLLAALASAPASAPARAQTPADTARRVPVVGALWDSVAVAPLVGGVIQLVDPVDPTRVLTAATDSLGRFRLPPVRPGRYLIGFIHPTLDLLSLTTPTAVVDVVGDSVSRVDLAIPGPARVRALVCGQRGKDDSTALLVGLARDAETGDGIDGARVVLTWWELELGRGPVRTVPRHVAVPATAGGRFAACGLPVDADITAVAEAPGRRSGVVELKPAPRGVHRRDLALGPLPASPADTVGGRTGTAALRGAVRRGGGHAVEGAHVVVIDTRGDAHTRGDGSFAIGGLPSGTYTVEARAVGYAPARATVDLSSREPASVDLLLLPYVPTLDRVVVRGQRTLRDRRVDEILDRERRNGFGHFVKAADLERRSVTRLTDGLRTVPGLQILPSPRGVTNVVRGRLQCVPDVWVDGMRIQGGADDLDMIVPATQVMGVEVYLGIAAVPAQFSRYGNDCGVVLVWTK